MRDQGRRFELPGSHHPTAGMTRSPQQLSRNWTDDEEDDGLTDPGQFGAIGDPVPVTNEINSRDHGHSYETALRGLSQARMAAQMEYAVRVYYNAMAGNDGPIRDTRSPDRSLIHSENREFGRENGLFASHADPRIEPFVPDHHEQRRSLNPNAGVFRPGAWRQPGPWRCSVNYRGNPFLSDNQSSNIPEWDSCALWITQLRLEPTEAAYSHLLRSVRGCGKVYASVINAPDPAQGHQACAAKVVFFHATGALELLRRAAAGEFVVNGHRPRVVYNRIRSGSQQAGPESRVVRIVGPKHVVNVHALMLLFRQNFAFQTDDIVIRAEDADPDGFRDLEWHFGSYRCQASAAMSIIERQRRAPDADNADLWALVYSGYGVDPCSVQAVHWQSHS
ncbi:hypothetical protein AB5N19_03230 [Seiridium cardinale]|uniref:Uncharacterized protein n=1 Tax=Seiridium cardinale TaxID=138064 RepID=A0ABR2XG78_9PEZI